MRLIMLAFAVVMPLMPGPTLAEGEGLPCPQCPPMVEIPAPDGSRPLWMSRSEITFDQWRDCVAAGACADGQDDHGWGRGQRPVINVSWADANAYAAWLSARSGLACRLPTEAEWQHAASGGRATQFWWGDQAGAGMANCRDCNPHPIYGTRPAGSFPPNPFGLSDMNGNVWEWTADCWSLDKSQCRKRVIKGGSWYYYSANSKTMARAANDATLGSYNIGIRIVCLP